jgi:hypothetical protein
MKRTRITTAEGRVEFLKQENERLRREREKLLQQLREAKRANPVL